MKTVLNVKVDPVVKKAAQKLAHDIDLPLSVVVNHYLKQFIEEREIRFVARPMGSRLAKRLASMEKDEDHTQIFQSMEKAVQYLHSKVPDKALKRSKLNKK